MKNYVMIGSVLLLAACGSLESSKRDAAEGTYVKVRENEFVRAMDTLQLLPLRKDANTFYCIRRTGYCKVRNGVAGPYEHHADTSVGLFDASSAQVTDNRLGRVYSLSSDGRHIIIGGVTYNRVD